MKIRKIMCIYILYIYTYMRLSSRKSDRWVRNSVELEGLVLFFVNNGCSSNSSRSSLLSDLSAIWPEERYETRVRIMSEKTRNVYEWWAAWTPNAKGWLVNRELANKFQCYRNLIVLRPLACFKIACTYCCCNLRPISQARDVYLS